MEDRLERGFELHIPNEELSQQITTNDKNINNDDEPEWVNSNNNDLFSFDFKDTVKKNVLSLSLPDINFINVLFKGEMAPRVQRNSFYNNIEKMELDKDYYDTMNDIEIERLNFQHYVSMV